MLTDWRLTYGTTDFKFGTIDSKYVFPQDGPPDVSNLTIDDEDADRPRGDGILFGTDFLGGTTITFSIDVNGADEAESLRLLQDLAHAWRADEVRSNPGAVAMLTSHTGRVTFGRPRKFQHKLDLTPFGLTAVDCTFDTADSLWYSAPNFETVKLVPDLGGGLKDPLKAPLTTSKGTDRSQSIVVGGVAPVWPTITIDGPITNPVVEVVGVFSLGFNISLAADQSLTIDTRPWARTITRDGAGIAGSLDPNRNRLSEASIPPGTYELSLRGISPSGTPQAQITWRDAYPTM